MTVTPDRRSPALRHALLRAVLDHQRADGAFHAVVVTRGRRQVDWNGGVTGMVLRALAGVEDPSPELHQARQAACDFLRRCASADLPGAFAYWPPGCVPGWMGRLPPDVDDTAIIALELARHGRLSRDALLHTIARVLLKGRLARVPALAPPWIRRGVFVTWLGTGARAPLVDCCVNAHVIAVLAFAGVTHLPGYGEACAMLEDAVDWAGDAPARARMLAPFYADPVELALSVQHAVDCGAAELRPLLDRLRAVPWVADHPDPFGVERAVCCSAYGVVRWTSVPLAAARQLAATYR